MTSSARHPSSVRAEDDPGEDHVRGFRGDDRPLAVFAGPCVVESPDLSLTIARECQSVCTALGLSYVFKASFDKANRTSLGLYRGLAFDAGLAQLAKVREAVGVPVLTDVHERQQIPKVAEVADVIQIPAFLSRQTDLLLAAAASGRAVNVKKGQFLAPWDMQHVVEKLEGGGATEILLTERGDDVRLQRTRRRLPLVGADARARPPRRLRRHAQRAATRRSRRRVRRPAGVRAGSRPRRGRGGRRRAVPGGPPRPRPRPERRPEHGEARHTGDLLADVARIAGPAVPGAR